MSVASTSASPIYNENTYVGALGIGYENFNYKELAINTTEDNVILTDLDDGPVTARAITVYSTVACRFGLNKSTSDYDNEPQLPAETFLSVSCQITKVYGKSSQTGTLRIFYVW